MGVFIKINLDIENINKIEEMKVKYKKLGFNYDRNKIINFLLSGGGIHMNNYEKIRNKIDDLVNDILELQAQKDNTKYINKCFNEMINDLYDMQTFFSAEEFKQEIAKTENKEMTIDEMSKELNKNIEKLKEGLNG